MEGKDSLRKCVYCGVDNLEGARFCDVCGKPFEQAPRKQPTINVKAPRGVLVSVASGKTFELQPDQEMLIGRGDASRGVNPEILLDDEAALPEGVSRLHVKIFCQGNEYFVLDLNSTNSTYLNKQKLVSQEHYRIGDGDEIQLGRYVMRLRFV